MRPRLLLLLLLLLGLAGASLRAQGYETKFKAIGFKPGDVYHSDEGVHVSLTGGGLEVDIPLGPPLPGPIPIRPEVHYHGKYSQPLNPNWAYDQARLDGVGWPEGWSEGQVEAFLKAYKRWTPPNLPFGEAHPGYLLFRAGSTALRSASEPDLDLHSPFGKSTNYYLGMAGTYTYESSRPKDVSEIETLARTLAPEWDRASTPGSAPGCAVLPGTPVFESTGTAIGVRLSGGTTLVFGPSNDQIFRRWTASTTPIISELLRVPREILQVDQDYITLWRRDRNVYHHEWSAKDVNGTLADYRWSQSVYHPVWIKTRSGFRADVTIYREAASGHMACLSEGGLLTGYRVSINHGATWFQVGNAPGVPSGPTVTFGGMDADHTEGASFTGYTPPKPLSLDSRPSKDFQPGTTVGYEFIDVDPLFWELEYTSAALGFAGDSITYGGLTTTFEWKAPHGQLSRMTTPSGKTYAFTYQLFQGIGTSPRAAASGTQWLWTSDASWALDYYSMVTRMDVLENAAEPAQTRSTTYRWKLPEVDPASPAGTIRWASPAQGVAQTLPSGETILHVFSPPMDGSLASASLEMTGRTILASRQAVIARYHYASGDTSWEPFITRGEDPALSSWYARERFEGWDLRSWETWIREPRGHSPIYLSSNTEPRPTRTIKEEKDGPIEVAEQDGWDADLGTYSVRRTYLMAAGTGPKAQWWAPGSMQGLNAPLTPGESSYVRRPGLAEPSPAGALAHQVTRVTHSSDPSAALLDREQRLETKVLLAPPTGATGFTGRVANVFEGGARAHIVARRDQLDLLGGSRALSLSFDQRPLGLYAVNQLQGVTYDSNVAGVPLSGQVGATYAYDPTGRFLTSIQQMGVSWREQEPDHDDMGRPLSRQDPNGFTTRYAWDILGRLTDVSPAQPETPTHIAPERSLRKTTVSQGSQVRTYHYNGYGELIGEERTALGGQVSHKIHGYDPGGRKTFETVWRKGPVSDFTEWAKPKAASEGITAWAYDGRGRVIRLVNANGEGTDTRYPTPLRTEVTRYPEVAGLRRPATTVLEKDVLGRLVKVTDAAGQTTSYAYDAAGRIRKVQQGLQVRSWTYDLFGRLDTLTQPESGITQYSGYTITGKPTQTVYGFRSSSPRTLVTTYDSLSRPTTVISLDGTVDQAFAYDGAPAGGKTLFGQAQGRLNYSRDKGVELWYVYNGLNGRLSGLDTRVGDGEAATGAGQTFRQSYGYSADGLRISAAMDGRTQRLSLDESSRLPLGVTHSDREERTATVATFTQDGLSWLPTRIDFGNGAWTTLGYRNDQTGLASMSHALPGDMSPRAQWLYAYDDAGQLKGDGQDGYQYDVLGRLIQARIRRLKNPQILTQAFAYDATGNLLSSFTTADTGALPAALSNFTFPASATELVQRNQLPAALTGAQYDPQGNLTYLWKAVSAAGPHLEVAYDALGRVSALFDSATGLKEAYAYTAEGLRTRIDAFRGSTLLKTRYRIYNDQRQLISEYDIAWASSSTTGTSPAGGNQATSLTSRGRGKAKIKALSKQAMTLAEGRRHGRSAVSKGGPRIRYRNNNGTFPAPTPTLIDNNGPSGAYITYPIGDITIPQGSKVSFTGTTDFGTDYSWDFGDGTPTVYGSFSSGSRGTCTVDHVFNALSSPSFLVTFMVRNTAGGYTLSTATLRVAVVPASLPVIGAFTANGLRDTATVYWGDPATLAWDVTGATSLSIDQGLGPVGPATSGSVPVMNLQATTTYTLTATNAAGSVTQGVRIRVLPKVQSFSADLNPIDAGTEAILAWNVAGATLITLQEGSQPAWDVTGTTARPVSPLAPSAYALLASNADGAAPASVLQLDVVPVIRDFQASPSTLSPGQASTLSWSTVGADLTLSLDPGIGTVSGTSLVVSPTATTTYTLTARNSYTRVSRTATLGVAPDLQAPTVTASESGTSGIILLSADATDNVGIARVEFRVDGGAVGSTTVSPYRLNLDSRSLADGSHVLTATAYDPSGNAGTSPGVAFTLQNTTGTAPAITTQPSDQAVIAGQAATFAVTASGSGSLAYQWRIQPPGTSTWMPIPGAAGAIYTTPPTTPADDGALYAVDLTNAYGSVTSAPARLTVNAASPIGRLVWTRDIVYVGTREVGEIDPSGLHITQVDHLGSPRLLSDRNGALEDEQKYLPFGQYLDGSQKTAKGFTNHEQTDPSGLIYMQARFYAPWYGRFLSPDPARDQHFEETQSWNIYSYVQNNPVMKIDPTGMFDWGAFYEKALNVTYDITVNKNPVYQALAQVADVGVATYNAVAGKDLPMVSTLGQSAERGAPSSEMAYRAVEGAATVMEAEVGGNLLGRAAGAVEGALAGRAASRTETEVVERMMSKAELKATQETGLVRGGREGEHFVTDSASSNGQRARQRLALDRTPEVKATLEVPKGKFSAPSKVQPKYGMPGGGAERTATGKIPVKVKKWEPTT